MNEGSLDLSYKRLGKQGKVVLTAALPDGTTFTDTINVADAKGRGRFLAGLCKGRRGIKRPDVEAALERLAAEIAQQTEERKVSQADRLVELVQAAGVELFHTPGGHDSEPYATVVNGDHKETWPINSRAFGRYLARLFETAAEKVPGSQAVQDAKTCLAGIAVHDGPEHPVAVRMAEHGGALWLDLANDRWEAVRITAAGWDVVTDAPVKFLRKRGMLALPAPQRGGSVWSLMQLVNLPDQDSRLLVVGWLVAALRPGKPFPVLNVNGEQGCAKSTLCRMVRDLIDPNQASLRSPPRDEDDLVIAANNGWCVAYDNLSGVKPELSDAICRLATGGGFGKRELYTDDDEKLFSVRRPVLINGIDNVISRSDLLDRAINLSLPVIDPADRRDEEQLWQQYERDRPFILGALLDAISTALRNLPTVRLDELPRMADFGKWVTAAEPSLGLPAGSILEAFNRNKSEADVQVIEHSHLAQAVVRVVEVHGGFLGTATELLHELEKYGPDDVTRRQLKSWPKDPRILSGMLKRLAPNLRRAEGINVVQGLRDSTSDRTRLIRLERVGKTASGSVRPSDATPEADNAWTPDPDASVQQKDLYGHGAYGQTAAQSDAADGGPHGCSENDDEGIWTG